LTDSEIYEILGTYPDKTAEALERWKLATLERERHGSKLYLELKAMAAGEKGTVKELEMKVESDDKYYGLRMGEIKAEAEHMKAYEKLMAAKKMASIRAGF